MKTTGSILIVLLSCLVASSAFVQPQSATGVKNALNMVKFDKAEGKWVTTSADEGPESAYPLYQSLLMHGPSPFFNRVFSPDDYEQGVLKFMATDKCTRVVAMGNMDRFLDNGQDWAFERMEAEKKGRPYPSYHIFKPKQAILSTVWGLGITTFIATTFPKYFFP